MKLPRRFSGCLAALWALPLVVDITYVYLFGVNMPWMDQFNFVPLLGKPLPEVFWSHQFFLQHNEHKMYFPRFIMILLGHLTKYNVVAEMYFIQLLLLGSLGILWLELRRHFSDRLNGKLLIWFLPVPFLVFSLRQHVNLLFGFQIQQACVLLLGLLCFFLIERLGDGPARRWGVFSAAIFSAFLVSFSSAGGLLVWPVAWIQLFLLGIEKKLKRRLMLVWAAFGTGTWFLYFLNYQKPSQHPSTFYALHHPLEGIGFFFAYIGGAVFQDVSYAVVAGFMIVIVSGITLIHLCQDGKVKEQSFWLAVFSLAYITAVSAVASRSGFGVCQASASKYSTFSIPILVVLYVLQVDFFLSGKRRGRSVLLGLVLGLILLGVFGSFGEALRYARDEHATRMRMRRVLRTYQSGPVQRLAAAHPEPERAYNSAKLLEKLHYSVFAVEGHSRKYIWVCRHHMPSRTGEPTLFEDGFESGKACAWGRVVGQR